MCPGPQGVFCLWHFWSSLTPQQHLQDFSWNWETDTKFAAICAKQLFLNVTLDAWYSNQGKQPRAASQGCAVAVGPSPLWPKFVEAPSVLTTKSTACLYFLVDPPAPSVIFSSPVTLPHVPGFAKCAPHATGNNLLPSFALSSNSREQDHKLNSNHTESCLQCKPQGVFIVQMPLMKSTQISP